MIYIKNVIFKCYKSAAELTGDMVIVLTGFKTEYPFYSLIFNASVIFVVMTAKYTVNITFLCDI